MRVPPIPNRELAGAEQLSVSIGVIDSVGVQTDYVDLYFIQMVEGVEDELTKDIRRWVDKAKIPENKTV